MLQAMSLGLVGAELGLRVAVFLVPVVWSRFDIVVDDFVGAPGMGKNCIGGYAISAQIGGEGVVAGVASLQEPHCRVITDGIKGSCSE